MPVNVLIADDHFPVRLGLEIIVRETLGQWTHIDFARNGTEIIQNVQNTQYDMLITDINMPSSEITSIITHTLHVQPALKILVVSVNSKETFAPLLMRYGIYGYVSKNDDDNNLKKAINSIFLGKKYFAQELLLDRDKSAFADLSENPFSKLSKRELEVTYLLLKGSSLAEIGKVLQLETSTASTYKGRVFQKLNINTIIELSILAKRFCIISDEAQLY